jgi:hypothetical protein
MTERSAAARVRDSARVTVLVVIVALAFWSSCYAYGERLDAAETSVVVALAAGLVLGARAVHARLAPSAARHRLPDVDAASDASDGGPPDRAPDRAPRVRRRARRR